VASPFPDIARLVMLAGKDMNCPAGIIKWASLLILHILDERDRLIT